MFKCEKYHGCGNDFIVCEYDNNVNYSIITPKVCNRYIGIGADTLITIDPKNIKISFYNADGTFAPMCGNGIRCAAAYLKHNNYIKNTSSIDIKTDTGVRKVYYLENDIYKINMGKPSFKKEDIDLEYFKDELFNEIITYKEKDYNVHAIFFTTHHLVILVDDLNISDEVGNYFCTHPMFKKGINVNFVKIIDRNTINLRTYERGCGWTKACGSGSTSSVCVLNKRGLVDDKVNVIYEYGTLTISKENDEFYMAGPAVKVADNIHFYE